MTLDVASCRRQFPALDLRVNGHTAAFFDGPGGTQVPQTVIDAIGDCLRRSNANLHGEFVTSHRADEITDAAQQAGADFFGTPHVDAIHFGQNMTSLTFALSRAIARNWEPGDEVVVTELDHDANVSPWLLAAEDRGATPRKVRFDLATGTLDLDHLAAQLNSRTRLVAVGAASNALGTINPVREIADLAHRSGALVFVDAVHWSSHAAPDVAAWDCDFCACSPYKFFGPHLGMMYGRPEALQPLEPYKVRPAPADPPGCWMTGTQSHEALAGFVAAVDYFAAVGGDASSGDRRERLQRATVRIREYEQVLCREMLEGLQQIDGLRLLGLGDVSRLADRVPTFSFTLAGIRPRDVARKLGQHGIFAWNGNFYALSVSQAYGLEPEGMVRVGAVHYNTSEEVERLLTVLRSTVSREH